jgi:hypothetical protein
MSAKGFSPNIQGTNNLLQALRGPTTVEVMLLVTSNKVHRNDAKSAESNQFWPLPRNSLPVPAVVEGFGCALRGVIEWDPGEQSAIGTAQSEARRNAGKAGSRLAVTAPWSETVGWYSSEETGTAMWPVSLSAIEEDVA